MRSRRLMTAGAALLLLAAAGTACGGGDGRFDADVAEVRAAVDAGDAAGAQDALDRLAMEGLAAHQDGDLSDEEVAEMAALIAASRALVDQVVQGESSTTTELETTTTTTTTTTAPAPPPEPGGHGKGKGKKDDD